MDFIDKQDDAAFGFDYFIDNRFQTFFKFTFVFGSGNQCAHIQWEDLFVLQVVGYITSDDTVCQAFNKGGLTGTRLTD